MCVLMCVCVDMKGTETHMAPEVVKAERCGTKADVWSCSCMLLHMRTGCHPWTRLYSRPLYLTVSPDWLNQMEHCQEPTCCKTDSSAFWRATEERWQQVRVRGDFSEFDPQVMKGFPSH